MSRTRSLRRCTRVASPTALWLVVLLALLAGPSATWPRVVDATSSAASSESPSAARPERPLVRHLASHRSHALATPASLAAVMLTPRSRPVAALAGGVDDHRPAEAGSAPSRRPSSRGPPR